MYDQSMDALLEQQRVKNCWNNEAMLYNKLEAIEERKNEKTIVNNLIDQVQVLLPK